MTARVAIDLNVRVRGNQTYAGFEDVDGGLAPGDDVEVYEPESGLVGQGRVTDVDNKRQLVYLAVDWAALHEPNLAEAQTPPLTVWYRIRDAVLYVVHVGRSSSRSGASLRARRGKFRAATSVRSHNANSVRHPSTTRRIWGK